MKEPEISKQEQEEDAAIEKILSELRPVALSEHFFATVEKALAEEEETLRQGDNRVPFPATVSAGRRFSLRAVASVAALVFCAGGLGFWGFSVYSGGAARSGEAVADAGTALPVGEKAENQPGLARSHGNYRLVNVARTMNSVKPMDVEMLESGLLAREIHYDYVDEYSYEDNETGAALIELRPNKGVASMELEVY